MILPTITDAETYDFIITGAGSAGCVVAARLSESGTHRVLLLEAGGRDRSPWIHLPLGVHKVYVNPSVNWMFESEPIPGLNNRTSYQPRGKVLGGSSSINGMIYKRGTLRDYDEWRQRGCEGWGWEQVLPFFKKAENQSRGADEFHGFGGPLNVYDMHRQSELATVMVEACVEAGIPFNADFNGRQQEGAGYYQTTTNRWRRWSSATAYLRPARNRSNLVISPQSHATRILFAEGRATGVEYRTLGGFKRAAARREVIVSGGSYGSPQLLQLSGIGPGALLQEMGIAVVRDASGVGNNLQDHFNVHYTYRCTKPVTFNDLYNNTTRRVFAGLQYALTGSGPLAGNGIFAGAFVRSDPRLEQPDLQINMFGMSIMRRNREGLLPHPHSGFTVSPCHLRPEGRGSVRLKSPDPLMAPAIRLEFLTTDYDRQAMLAGIAITRKITSQPVLKPYIVDEVDPGATVTSDEDKIKDLRNRGASSLHPIGTCSMGREPTAVVDARLRVHGVGGLRVIDASIMPSIVGGNTNAPAIMIGEKGAQVILADVVA